MMGVIKKLIAFLYPPVVGRKILKEKIMKNLKLAVLAGIAMLLGFSQAAMAVPMFARMYGYNCATCHAPSYGQLNKFGYEFRSAGFRPPEDLGKKEANDGKFDFGNYATARFSAGVNVTTTVKPKLVPVPDSGSFNLGGASIYLGGAISKNFYTYNEFGFGNGTGIFPGTTPSLSHAIVGWATGDENQRFSVQAGKFSADGYGASDRGPVGNGSINSTARPTGTGIQAAYSVGNTDISLAFFDGIQDPTTTGLVDSKGKPVTSSSIQAPASDGNNAKDIQLFITQFVGDNGMAFNGTLYNGYKGGNGDNSGVEYYNAALWFYTPIGSALHFKSGILIGQTNTGIFAASGTGGAQTGGYFGEVDYELDELTPLVFRLDYTSTDLSKSYTDSKKFTLGLEAALAETVYINPTFATTVTDAAIGSTCVFTLSSSLLMFI
jgi:hypothetical protein